ncbi:DHHW family protein [Sporosalibacterium faouarense]|uniref:DHHW family protein n=1 Tax=Sporosalibacterium faouarense TaxID=516123 RepID=UPI00141CE855|nr:DHHW family protein [Sporosalibacterium faouarense]MTI48914.1 hypothetical protein [Bacillota bacterium]
MKANRLNIVVFIIIIFSLSIVNILNPHKPKISEIERRVLKPMPEFSFQALREGLFLKEYDEHFADTFIFRESFVKLSKTVNTYRGVKSDDNIKLITNYGDNIAQIDNLDKIDVNAENEDPVTILFKDNRALTLHKFYPEKAQNYANAINKFRNKLNDGVRVYSLLVPDQIEFIKDEKYKSLSDPQDFTLEYVNMQLKDNVEFINIYDSLKNNSDKYLYFKTDHHWTDLGAYYGYTGFIKQLGETPVDLSMYKVINIDNFLGTRYALNEELASNPDTVQVFMHKDLDKYQYSVYNMETNNYESADLFDMSFEDGEKGSKYGIFLGGDRPLAKIISSNKNGRKILIIKDSYGNAFTPFLIPHFEEIYVVDPRHFDMDIFNLIEKNNIGEVLFLNTIHVTSKNGYSKVLENLSK